GRRPPRGSSPLPGLPKTNAAPGIAECRLHLPESGAGSAGARWHPAIGGGARRSCRPHGRRAGPRTRLSPSRQPHRQFRPLLARRGRVHIAPPGGDFPARRTIDTHLAALKAMGAREIEAHGHALEAPDGLHGVSMYLDEASVTGTETALLAAACATGQTEIRHAATEPH